MTGGFLDRILPDRRKSTVATVAWSVFFVLFPVAFVAGSYISQRELGRRVSDISVDRGTGIATARQFMTDRGVDVTAWTTYLSVEPTADLINYYQRHRDRTGLASRSVSLVMPIRVRVLLMSPESDTAEITLDASGRLVNYVLRLKSAAKEAPVDEAQAAAAALDTVSKIPNLTSVLPLGKPEIGVSEQVTGPACRKYTWHSSNPQLPGLTFEIATSVCGAKPYGRTVKSTLDPDYAKAQSLRPDKTVNNVMILYAIFMAFVFIYSFYRYARRSFEREASHVRTLLLGLAIGAAFTLNFLVAVDEYVFGNFTATQTVQWFPVLAAAISFVLMGLAIAIAYEAGEGDLREFYPGKLTSLDALLRGKIFSKNVARSVLFGTACAGWLVLVQALANAVLHPEAGDLGKNFVKLAFFRYPLLAIFVAQAITVTIIPASGLLLPLGFLHRNVRRIHLRNFLLLEFAFMASLIHVSEWSSFGAAMGSVAILTAGLLGPFLVLDFLAVMFSVLAWQIANSLSFLVGFSAAWVPLSIGVGLIALVFLICEAWAASRGREYRDEEVRPLYARHISERQSLEAEMEAARAAQLHLLPKDVPNISGLSISAALIPARIVGGDFYDFYPLSNDRLGIFIAEGGNRGVGAALSIALAKGFLMHTVRKNLAPHEVLVRLETALGNLLERASGDTTVAYAVIDTGKGEIRYARTGDYPRVLIPNQQAQEMRIEIPGSNKAVYTATLTLRGGDSILLFTDGIARRVKLSGSNAADEILHALSRKRRSSEEEDDLTAVVVRVTRIGAVMEGVA